MEANKDEPKQSSKYQKLSDQMDQKSTDAGQYYKLKMIDCTDRALTENHLSQYPKETLINFIIKHKVKLLEGVKKHKRDYNKQPKKALDFDSQPKVRVALKFSYLGMDYKGLVI
jgi:hypothetical protein